MKHTILGLLTAYSIVFSVGAVANAGLNTKDYQYNNQQAVEVNLTHLSDRLSEFSFSSFDGDIVYGQISYPADKADSYPVLLGLHAMGRSAQRWWVDDINGRKTLTHVNKISELAEKSGHVVIALDARYHGKRKDPNMTLRQIMTALKKEKNDKPYRGMIINTVKDYRMLLDWIETQPQLRNNDIEVAGYSMGAQQSLLLAALDKRIGDVLAIVPPFIEESALSVVSPLEWAPNLKKNRIKLITADADEYATKEQNHQLYQAISSNDKSHTEVVGGHVLPESYLSHIEHWFNTTE